MAIAEAGRLACAAGHSFDVARQGYVNLLVARRRRSRSPGDADDMVAARRRFLASGAYDPLSDAVAAASRALMSGRSGPRLVLDVGCGEGRHTRRVAAALAAPTAGAAGGGSDGARRAVIADQDGARRAVIAGIDVSKAAVALAARAHPEGWYAVATVAELPVATAAAGIVIDVFGPLVVAELARVVCPGGAVVAAHPGPRHLGALRELVYAEAHATVVKDPLRAGRAWFEQTGAQRVTFPIVVAGTAELVDLFTMTPYRWHAPDDVGARLAAAAAGGLTLEADVVVSTFARNETPAP